MANCLIVGATSALAHELARRLAVRGDCLILVGSEPQKLDAIAVDLRVLGAQHVDCVIQDLGNVSNYDAWVQSLISLSGQLDLVLLAQGTLPEHAPLQQQATAALQAMQLNAFSYIGLLTPLANYFEKQGSGCIAVISSITGDRGQQNNYVNGAANSMVTTFCQGLRNRLAKANVQVLTIKLGFYEQNLIVLPSMIRWIAKPTAEQIADNILMAIYQKKDVVYLPKAWRLIMLLIQHIPEGIFKRFSW